MDEPKLPIEWELVRDFVDDDVRERFEELMIDDITKQEVYKVSFVAYPAIVALLIALTRLMKKGNE